MTKYIIRRIGKHYYLFNSLSERKKVGIKYNSVKHCCISNRFDVVETGTDDFGRFTIVRPTECQFDWFIPSEPRDLKEKEIDIQAVIRFTLQEALCEASDGFDKMIKKINKIFHDRCKLNMKKIIKFCAKHNLKIEFKASEFM